MMMGRRSKSKLKCRRTVCENLDPVCRHTQTGEMYCVSCARKINNFSPDLVEIPISKVAADEPVSR